MIVRSAISPNRTFACEWEVIAAQLSPTGIQRPVDCIVVHSGLPGARGCRFATTPGLGIGEYLRFVFQPHVTDEAGSDPNFERQYR